MTHITTPVEPFSPAHSDMGVEGSNQRDPCLFDEETSGLCIALAEGSHPTDPDTLFPDGCLFEVPPNKPQPTTTTRDVPATDDAMEDFVFSDVDFTGFGDAANDGFMQTGNSLLPLHDTHNNFTINTSSLTDSGLLSPHQDINSPNNNPCIPALTTSALSVKPELTSPAQLTSSDSTNFTRSGLRPPDHVAQRTAEPNAPGRPFSMSRLAVPTAIPAQHFPAQPSVPPDDGTLTFLSRQNSAASHRSNLSLRSTHSRPASSHSHAPAPPNANVRLPLADPGQAGAPPGGPGAGGAGAGAGSSLALSFGSDGGAVSDFDSPGNPPSSAGPGSGADSGSVPSFSAPTPTSLQLPKVESNRCCDICGYRPKGDPQWFKGSMAKHRKLQHSNAPPKIYKCPYPGCKSAYKNRPDNLRQHQIDKGHFVDDANGRRPSKRKKVA